MALKENEQALLRLQEYVNPIVHNAREDAVAVRRQIFLGNAVPARVRNLEARRQALRQRMIGNASALEDAKVLLLAFATVDPIHVQNRRMRRQARPHR